MDIFQVSSDNVFMAKDCLFAELLQESLWQEAINPQDDIFAHDASLPDAWDNLDDLTPLSSANSSPVLPNVSIPSAVQVSPAPLLEPAPYINLSPTTISPQESTSQSSKRKREPESSTKPAIPRKARSKAQAKARRKRERQKKAEEEFCVHSADKH